MGMLVQDEVFHRIERVYLPKWRSLLGALLVLPSRTPLQVGYYRSPTFFQRAAELMLTHDACLAHLIRTGDGIKSVPGVKFLEMTDAISLNYARVGQGTSLRDPRTVAYAIEAQRLIEYERRIVKYFNHSFLVSDVDRQFLFGGSEFVLERVSVCSNGVDVSLLPYQFAPAGRDIVFIGNLYSLQNFDAAHFFVRDVLPLIRKRLPDQRVRIIGRIKPEQAGILSEFEGVYVTGEVASVAQAANGAGVGVCPVRIGAGVQNKVLEYMALGLPVVSTHVGLEGFTAEPENNLLVADDALSIALAVLSLLEDRELAERMARSARLYVETQHIWGAVLQPFIEQISMHLPPMPAC